MTLLGESPDPAETDSARRGSPDPAETDDRRSPLLVLIHYDLAVVYALNINSPMADS